jgi:DtxR family manganese transport transcriptional regulator
VPSRRQPDLDVPERFVTTRQAHRDETAEDYVEAIDQLITLRGEARVGELGKVMGVSHVTVTRIIARLQREGLVETEPRKPITLTASGKSMAEESRARHELVLGFLIAAGVDPRQAQIDAEGIEHHVSDETLEALRRLTRSLQE